MYFQDLILTLQKYWNEQGCLLTQPYDVEKGAGTFNPATFFRALGPEPFKAAYAEPCRRPTDGRYGDNPIRMQHYYQFQVILKPNPANIMELYLGSLKAIGILPEEHDIRFVHDDWETAALGAWGLGWEVWCDGTEVTQFTYFQQVGGIELTSITGEITYGLERLCMFLQGVDSVFDLKYNKDITYGDLFHQNEVQYSRHNFELADTDLHFKLFESYEKECLRLCSAQNPAPALDFAIKASHSFNLLDARSAISVNERQGYVMRIRQLAKEVATAWLDNREALGFPLGTGLEEVPAPSLPVPPKIPPSQKEAPLLVELGVEEMPAGVFPSLMRDLPQIWEKVLKPHGLNFSSPRFYYTPRRIAILVDSFELSQEDKTLELKGPPLTAAQDKDGNWTQAARGFAKKNGVELEDFEIRNMGGGDYVFVSVEKKGRSACEILAEALPEIFAKIPWYKTMRWGEGTQTPFVRPVRWLVAVLGEQVIPTAFAGIAAGNQTWGHRFLDNRELRVNHGNYLETLKNAHVLVDQDERRQYILSEIQKAVENQALSWREDPGLLNEVNYLVEYPVIVHGQFAEEYLELPEEVIVSEMRGHQKYLALTDSEGRLHPSFIAVSGTRCQNMEVVRAGYQNVLVSRLVDGKFFLTEDQKKPLKDRSEKLGEVTFEESLGTIAAKVARLGQLADWVVEHSQNSITPESRQKIAAIAALCKNDLTTAMVYEFPELQGEMGRFYALKEGIDQVVADGIRDHYVPQGGHEAVNISLEAAVVGLADRMDSIAGLFSVGKGPTGSADPFAIRRACLGCILLLRNLNLNLSIRDFIAAGLDLQPLKFKGEDKAALQTKIEEFFLGRLKKLLQEPQRVNMDLGGVSPDTVESVARSSQGWLDITRFIDRVGAMHAFRVGDHFAGVAHTFKRVSNILETPAEGDPSETLFSHPEEKSLYTSARQRQPQIKDFLAQGQYIEALGLVGELQPFVDSLFDKVMINDPDEAIKQNRKRLIQQVKNLVIEVADFSAIQD